jgi:cytidylate kinase
MPIVTIAREMAALGEETAAELGRLTGFRIVDRDYIEKRLVEHGFRPERQQKFDERRPRLWSSISEDWADYLQYLKLALYEEASEGDCIVVGRGGSVIFRKLPSHLAVRVAAPLDLRVARTMERFACDERQARQMVEQCDHDRVGFSRIYFESGWADPREYDLTLNTRRLDAPRAARTIQGFLALTIGEDDETAGRRMIPDLLLGQKVLIEIACVKRVRISGLTAVAEAGLVTLGGVSSTKAAVELAAAAARSVPGVRGVESGMHLAREYEV